MPITLGILAQSREVVAAGDFVLLETQVLTGTEASITFSNLSTSYSSTYKHLQLRYVARATGASRNRLQINGNTGNNYGTHLLFGTDGVVFSAGAGSFDKISLGQIEGNESQFSTGVIDILDAFNTNKNKTVRALCGSVGTSREIALTSGFLNSTATVSSLRMFTDSPSYVSGSRFSLYGVR